MSARLKRLDRIQQISFFVMVPSGLTGAGLVTNDPALAAVFFGAAIAGAALFLFAAYRHDKLVHRGE